MPCKKKALEAFQFSALREVVVYSGMDDLAAGLRHDFDAQYTLGNELFAGVSALTAVCAGTARAEPSSRVAIASIPINEPSVPPAQQRDLELEGRKREIAALRDCCNAFSSNRSDTVKPMSVVSFFGAYVQEPGELLLVFEPVAANLQSLLDDSIAFTEPQIATIMKTTVSALQHIHNCGWAHLAVCPAALWARRDGSICLADFECARRPATDAETHAFGALYFTGSPGFTAPELMNCPDFPDRVNMFAADCWSCGATAARLGNSSSSASSSSSSILANLRIALGCDPQTNSNASPAYADFIGRCCEANLLSRPSLAEIASHSFLQSEAELLRIVGP